MKHQKKAYLLLSLWILTIYFGPLACGGDSQIITTGQMDMEISDPAALKLGKAGQAPIQVTVEVRFLTVTDDFFERIGIDFDFNADDPVAGSVNVEGIGNIDVLLNPDQNSMGTIFKLDEFGQPLGESNLELNFQIQIGDQLFNQSANLIGQTGILDLQNVLPVLDILDQQGQTKILSIPRITIDASQFQTRITIPVTQNPPDF